MVIFVHMKTSDIQKLKLPILGQVENLNAELLREIFGLISNHVNSKKELNDWENLSEEEQMGLENAIKSINQGRFLKQEDVMTQMRAKYG